MLETRTVQCPYCWEPIEVVVDPSAGGQEYIEDCSVCCHPITFTLHVDDSGEMTLDARGQEE
jgi:hypothetical protein